MVNKEEVATTFQPILDRVAYNNHTSKNNGRRKTSTKKALLTKISLPWLLEQISIAVSQVFGDEVALVNYVLALHPNICSNWDQSFGQVTKTELDKLDTAWSDVSLDDAQDLLHNVDKVKTKLEVAKKTLQADMFSSPTIWTCQYPYSNGILYVKLTV